MTRRRTRWAFTLLEVLLALLIAGVVVTAVSVAINVQWRVLHSGRRDVEEAQLARTILRRMADDLQSTIRYEPIDVEALLPDLSAEALASAAASANNAGSGSSGGGSSSGSGGSSGGSQQSGGSSGGGGTSSGAAGGSGGTSSGMQSSASGSAAASAGGESASSLADAASSIASDDLSAESTVSSVPGLYGNQYQLQVDVSRLPRVDQYNPLLADPARPTDVASDVKTVTYYVLDPASATSTNPGVTGGLVRREVDRAVTVYAYEGSDLARLAAHDLPLAPEVAAVEFAYFDGAEWWTEWDSNVNGGLPTAVAITLVFGQWDRASGGLALDAAGNMHAAAENARVYQMLVHLPNAQPASASASTTGADTGVSGGAP